MGAPVESAGLVASAADRMAAAEEPPPRTAGGGGRGRGEHGTGGTLWAHGIARYPALPPVRVWTAGSRACDLGIGPALTA